MAVLFQIGTTEIHHYPGGFQPISASDIFYIYNLTISMLYQDLDVLVCGDTIIVRLHHDVDVVNLGLELQ